MRSRDAPSDSPSPETAEKPKPDQTIPNQQSSRGGRVARRKHFAIRRPKLVAQSHDGSADQAKMAARARASNRTAARGPPSSRPQQARSRSSKSLAADGRERPTPTRAPRAVSRSGSGDTSDASTARPESTGPRAPRRSDREAAADS